MAQAANSTSSEDDAGRAANGPAGFAMNAGVASWWLYDWANSAFGTLITTFIFGPYFISSVAPSPAAGAVLWAYAASAAALIAASLSPVLGAIADHGGDRKTWLLAATAICVVSSALLYLVEPRPGFIALALGLFVCAATASELALVFYNSMLPSLAPPHRTGAVSGVGLGVGYLGGLAALAAALVLLVGPGAPFAAIDRGGEEPVRAAGILVAAWYAAFSIPLFLFTPARRGDAASASAAIGKGLRALLQTLRRLRRRANILRFLIAFLFYSNGISTLFAFGGVYAVGVFGLSYSEIIGFGIVLNVAAGLGAGAFSGLSDRIGAKATIMIALAGLTASGATLVLTRSVAVLWIVGALLGALVGAVQATSRALMARLSPHRMETQMFGLYALSGKATAFAGPLVLAAVTDLFDSQRAGMATVLGFFVLGGCLLVLVKEPARR